MTYTEFLALPGPKYAVISKARHMADPFAVNLFPAPGEFYIGGVPYVAMNMGTTLVGNMAEHYAEIEETVVFEFTTDTDKVPFLTLQQTQTVKWTLGDPESVAPTEPETL